MQARGLGALEVSAFTKVNENELKMTSTHDFENKIQVLKAMPLFSKLLKENNLLTLRISTISDMEQKSRNKLLFYYILMTEDNQFDSAAYNDMIKSAQY